MRSVSAPAWAKPSVAFPGLRARTQGNDTLLSGSLADRAALYGVLAMIETLGLELV